MTPPPVVRPPLPPPPDPRIGLWVSGAILGVVGLFMALFDRPYVPLSYVFHLVPLSVGGGVGVAVLRERHRVAGIVVGVLASFWLVWQILDVPSFRDRTTFAPLFLFSGVLNLTRAGLKTFREE